MPGFATRALHADDGVPDGPDVAPPIHVSTTFAADNSVGLVYSRDDQPTRQRLEAVLGALEGGHAVAYSSGQAATHAALLHFLRPAAVPPTDALSAASPESSTALSSATAPTSATATGRLRRVVLAPGGYHGTRALFARLAESLGITLVPLDTPIEPDDLIWLETPKNPTCEIFDVARYAERAHAAGAYLAVDSTFATPVLQNPLALGADLVMHASTKFLSGHSDALGGALIVASAGAAEALRSTRTLTGAVPGALETWLTLRGLRTLALRVERQSASATQLAGWLAGRVARVWHPSRPEHPGYAVAQQQMRGPGAVLAIELDDERAAEALPRRLRVFRDATSLGGVESLAEWRRRHDPHAPPALVRFSVGLEDPEDLIADLEQALR